MQFQVLVFRLLFILMLTKKYKIRGTVLELILEGNPSILYQNKLYYTGDEFNCNGVLSVKVFKKSVTVYDTKGSLIIEFFHNIDLGPSAVIKLSNEMTFFMSIIWVKSLK